jgi:hypothetical protein
MCYDKIKAIHEKIGNNGFIGVFSFSDMPMEEAARNMTLFAKEVAPEIRKLHVPLPLSADALGIAAE